MPFPVINYIKGTVYILHVMIFDFIAAADLFKEDE